MATQAQAFYSEKLGLDARHAAPYDGVSLYSGANGTVIIRVVQQNFFVEHLDVRVQDYPYDKMPSSFKTFVCGECGGQVRLLKATGDDFLIIRKEGRTYQTAIPNHLDIPKCDYCSTTYFGESEYKRVSMAMGADQC